MSLEKNLYNRLENIQRGIERNKNKILPYGNEGNTDQEVNYDEVDEKLYYNLTIFNPATTFDNKFNTETLTGDFDVNRVDDVVKVPSEWQVAIQSFSVPNNIPIVVQRLSGGIPIPEDNIYKIILYNRTEDEGKSISLNFNALDSILPVGAVYDYEKLILIVNQALDTLGGTVEGSGVNPYVNSKHPFFSRDNATQILGCWMPVGNYQLNGYMEIYFSKPLKDLLSGFSYQLASDNVLPLPAPQTLDDGFYRLMPFFDEGNPFQSVSTEEYLIGIQSAFASGGLFDGTYLNVPVVGGTGTGGLVDVIISGGGTDVDIEFSDLGDEKYITGDVVVISGANVGGASPLDDIDLLLYITSKEFKNWAVLTEKWDCRPPASQFDKLIFRTSTIPVKNELIGEQKDILSRQILDYSLQARVNNGYQILYQPEVLKWSDMNSNTDLRRIGLNVILQRNGVQPRQSASDPIRLEEYPLFILPNTYFNVKLVFRRKQVYYMRSA